jgi:hypothetical protein
MALSSCIVDGYIHYAHVRELIKIVRKRHCCCIDNKEIGIKAKCRLCKDLDEFAGDELI